MKNTSKFSASSHSTLVMEILVNIAKYFRPLQPTLARRSACRLQISVSLEPFSIWHILLDHWQMIILLSKLNKISIIITATFTLQWYCFSEILKFALNCANIRISIEYFFPNILLTFARVTKISNHVTDLKYISLPVDSKSRYGSKTCPFEYDSYQREPPDAEVSNLYFTNNHFARRKAVW